MHLLDAFQQLVALGQLVQQLLAATHLQDAWGGFGSLHGLHEISSRQPCIKPNGPDRARNAQAVACLCWHCNKGRSTPVLATHTVLPKLGTANALCAGHSTIPDVPAS